MFLYSCNWFRIKIWSCISQWGFTFLGEVGFWGTNNYFSIDAIILIHFFKTFQATQEYGDRDKIMQVLEKHGGICDCQSSR